MKFEGKPMPTARAPWNSLDAQALRQTDKPPGRPKDSAYEAWERAHCLSCPLPACPHPACPIGFTAEGRKPGKGGRNKRIPIPEDLAEKAGMCTSYTQLGKLCGVSYKTVQKWVKQTGVALGGPTKKRRPR